MVIIENEIEPPEETREDILKQVEQSETQPIPQAQEPQTKAEGRTRMRELYKCEHCNKYLTKKALNYSHTKYCKGLYPPDEEPPIDEEPIVEVTQPPVLEQPPLSRMCIMAELRRQKREAKEHNIARLSLNIA